MKEWPLLGRLARMAGTVFIDRESSRSAWAALDAVERGIEGGSTVIVFPEGTTTNGLDVKEFKGFFFTVPVRMKISVQPLSIRYSTPVRGACPVAWYGDKELLPHAWNLLGIRRIEAQVYYNPLITSFLTEGSLAETRKLLCTAASEIVREGLSRLRMPPSPADHASDSLRAHFSQTQHRLL